MFKRKKLQKKGFTLPELLTSISIITLMTGLFLVNYRSTDRQTDLLLITQVMMSDLRVAQNYSLGLFEYEGEVPAGGWGVHFSTEIDVDEKYKYKIFADLNDNKEYDDSEAIIDLGGKVIEFPENIEIMSLEVDGEPVNTLNLVFSPPDPRTYINGEYLDNSTAAITLHEKIGGSTTKVNINFAGLIELDD